MLVTMSDKGLSRYKVINDVCEHRLRRSDAAQILNLSERQVQRLMNRLRESGAASLVLAASPVIIVYLYLALQDRLVKEMCCLATQKPSIRYDARLFRGVRLDMP
ncbi:helix-turn-helix domain-containing protein [Vibrio vulnificus]|uniref:helix-turn-helix domain-containing protein n=1 Tax=Vibrio vulnificus TaxID=672 RepID=UPI0035C842EC